MRLQCKHNDIDLSIAADREGDEWIVTLPDESRQRIAIKRIDDESLLIRVNDIEGAVRSFSAPFVREDGYTEIFYRGRVYRLDDAPRRARLGHDRAVRASGRDTSTRSGQLTSPMVGTVAEVLVRVGDEVDSGQTIVSIGSMKVYVPVTAPFAGAVAKMHVIAGSMVDAGAPIADIEPLRAATDHEDGD